MAIIISLLELLIVDGLINNEFIELTTIRLKLIKRVIFHLSFVKFTLLNINEVINEKNKKAKLSVCNDGKQNIPEKKLISPALRKLFLFSIFSFH